MLRARHIPIRLGTGGAQKFEPPEIDGRPLPLQQPDILANVGQTERALRPLIKAEQVCRSSRMG